MLRKVGVQQFCPVENGFVPGENTKITGLQNKEEKIVKSTPSNKQPLMTINDHQ